MWNGAIAFLTCLSTVSTSSDFGQGSRSPTRVVMMCRTAVPASASAATAPKLSSTISTVAPESASWWCNSRAV